MWMAVLSRRLSVCSPSCVCNTSVRFEGLGHVHTGLVDELSELDDLADLLECKDFISLVAVDGQTS